jgi:processive 1,2-diacylglycerol beta-glucosyltransferase
MKKTILILSSVYGNGHIATAQAVSKALTKDSPNTDVEIIDFGEVLGTFFNQTTKRTYDNWSKYTPLLYQIFFDATDRPSVLRALNRIGYRINKERLDRFFASKKADLILINAPGWVYIASLLSKSIIGNIPVVTLVTDTISLHTSWTMGSVDHYLVPNQDSIEVLHSMGIARSKLHSFGYPVDQRFFSQSFNRSTFLKKLGLDTDRKYFLYLPAIDSTLTATRLVKRLHKLYPDWGIVVICGRNHSLEQSLAHGGAARQAKIVGWTNQWPSFIQSSDIVITKAGGSTVMECIAAAKPQIINKIIPGQEAGNALFVEKNRLGEVCLNSKDLPTSIERIIGDYEGYQKRCRELTNPDVNQQIAKFLNDLM